MLRHVASLWFLSHHGIWLDYRLILICWVMALIAHIWLLYFSVCVCVSACVHTHACTHACTWELHICVCAFVCGNKMSALDTAYQV